MKFAIIDLQTKEILGEYDSPKINFGLFGGRQGSPDQSVHRKVPSGAELDTLKVVEKSGSLGLEIDPLKVEAKAQARIEAIRQERNRRLSESDWTQLQDSPLASNKRKVWATYRQKLRDLMKGLDPDAVEWPDKPM